jgi:hypothetical protein
MVSCVPMISIYVRVSIGILCGAIASRTFRSMQLNLGLEHRIPIKHPKMAHRIPGIGGMSTLYNQCSARDTKLESGAEDR